MQNFNLCPLLLVFDKFRLSCINNSSYSLKNFMEQNDVTSHSPLSQSTALISLLYLGQLVSPNPWIILLVLAINLSIAIRILSNEVISCEDDSTSMGSAVLNSGNFMILKSTIYVKFAKLSINFCIYTHCFNPAASNFCYPWTTFSWTAFLHSMIFQSLVLCFVQLLITLSLCRSFIFPYTHVASLYRQHSLFLHYLQIFLLYSIFIFLRPQTNSMNKRNKSSPVLIHVILCSSIQVTPKQYDLSVVYTETTP